jgi:AcrR family transcriptional regulator
MRITAEEKEATRERIEAAALELFRTRGFEATTTRDIAKGAQIATGTLFNYFVAKEAIVAALAEEGLAKAHAATEKQPAAETLEEDLFALVAAELRQLRPLRKFITPVLETALSPLSNAAVNGETSLRGQHLESVARIARAHGVAEISAVALQVYWSLYTGVLAFWAADKSPKQEETLALLDNSLHMFAAWLQDAPAEPR